MDYEKLLKEQKTKKKTSRKKLEKDAIVPDSDTEYVSHRWLIVSIGQPSEGKE